MANNNPAAIMESGMNRFPFLLSIAILLTACSGSKQASAKDTTAPATYRVDFDTSKGPFVVEITREQAPNGADHLYTLVKAKYFDGARFLYRVVPGFMVQWGAAADPEVAKKFETPIQDDPVKDTNARGTISFAATGQPNSRSTHMVHQLRRKWPSGRNGVCAAGQGW